MEPFTYYAVRNFMMILIKLPEHIPEIQENSLLQKYTAILDNNCDVMTRKIKMATRGIW